MIEIVRIQECLNFNRIFICTFPKNIEPFHKVSLRWFVNLVFIIFSSSHLIQALFANLSFAQFFLIRKNCWFECGLGSWGCVDSYQLLVVQNCPQLGEILQLCGYLSTGSTVVRGGVGWWDMSRATGLCTMRRHEPLDLDGPTRNIHRDEQTF